MPTNESDVPNLVRPEGRFLTTHWSVVLAARDNASPAGAQALEILCRTYWYPLYAFVRASGHSPHDAQDLTQEFFARLVTKNYLRVVQPEKGRFRTFMRMAMKRFLANEWERVRAEKRGGGQPLLSFDTAVAERQFQTESCGALGPEQVYDRHWALTVLGEVLARLEREYTDSARSAEWCELKPHLTAPRGQIPYGELAAALRTTEGAARVAVHRLRRRFRELFREKIAETVSGPDEIDAELHQVIQALNYA